MSEIVLYADRRSETGKQYAKRLRRLGRIPGVLYGPDEDPTPFSVEKSQLERVIHAGGRNAVISLFLNGEEGEGRKVMIREIQYDLLDGSHLHLDLQHISLMNKVAVEVPITIKGTPKGVREEEGILEHLLHSLEMECLPAEIPEKIEVDVSGLGVGESIHVGDLAATDSRIITEPSRSVVTVVPPTVAVRREEEAEEAVKPEAPSEEKKEPEPAPTDRSEIHTPKS